MLQIQRIRQEPETVIAGLKKRGIDASQTVRDLLEMDGERRSIRYKMEEKQARSNALAKEIGTVSSRSKPKRGSNRGRRATPLSITVVTPSMVSDVSAMLVANTIFCCFDGRMASSCLAADIRP